MITLYKRSSNDKPLVWSAKEIISQDSPDGPIKYIDIQYGLVGRNLHTKHITITKKNVNELQSRINAKRKEGYKEISELKDGVSEGLLFPYKILENGKATGVNIIDFLNTYLPKISKYVRRWDTDNKELKKVVDKEQIKKNLQDNSFRRMFEQKSAEWSEEDEKCIRLSKDIIDSALRAGFCVQIDRDRCVDWLKSLRPQSHWKPSEEQVEALGMFVQEYYPHNKLLKSLYNDLKQLKGE